MLRLTRPHTPHRRLQQDPNLPPPDHAGPFFHPQVDTVRTPCRGREPTGEKINQPGCLVGAPSWRTDRSMHGSMSSMVKQRFWHASGPNLTALTRMPSVAYAVPAGREACAWPCRRARRRFHRTLSTLPCSSRAAQRHRRSAGAPAAGRRAVLAGLAGQRGAYAAPTARRPPQRGPGAKASTTQLAATLTTEATTCTHPVHPQLPSS